MFRFGSRFNGAIYSKTGYDTTNIGRGSQKGVKSSETTATTNRYLPNNETLDSASVLDELTPQSLEGQLKIFRTIAKTDAVGGPAIDMLSSFPWSDCVLSGIKDKDISKFYEQAVQMLDPQTFLPQATASYLTDGKIVDSLIYDSSVGTFTDFIPQDPMYLDFEPIPVRGFDPKVNYKGNPDFKKFFHSSDERDALAKSKISTLLAEKLSSGSKVPLEPLNTLYVPRMVSPFDWLGTSMLWRILPFYAIEKALWNASIASARRRARSITHIKCGIQDYWEPTQEDLDNIVDLFMQSEEDPVGAYVITRDGVETNDVRQAQDFWKLSEEWDMLTAGKTRSLGMSEALLSGDTAIGTSEQATALFLESIKVMRSDLTNRIFYRKIFTNIARAHGFVKKDAFESTASALNKMDNKFHKLVKEYVVTSSVNGAGTYMVKGGLTVEQAYDIAYKDLLIPEITWRKPLSAIKDDSYMQLLQTLEEKGIPISKKTWSSAAGFDIYKQIEDIDEDLKIQKLIQDKLGDKVSKEEEDAGDEEGGWGAESSAHKITGIAEIFDTLVKPNGKTTFFGVGPNKLRKAVKQLFGNGLEILNDEKAVKNQLASFYDGNQNKVEAACYLLNRGLVTDVKISKSFLNKVLERINERMTVSKAKDLKRLVYERNFAYSQLMKYVKNKKKLNIPKSCPDKLKGNQIYSGITGTSSK